MISVPSSDMVEGYLNGFEAVEKEWPERLSNRGHGYKHGWINGCNDRLGKTKWNSRAEAEAAVNLAIEKDRMP